jgi:hypothetical protein
MSGATTDGAATGAPCWVDYDFAVLRAVPHPHTGVFVPVGVVVHARQAEFLALRTIDDAAELARRVPDADAELLARYLHIATRVCAGDDDAGPIALLPTSERFHWITAPRSDVLQCGPVHEGVCESPAVALDALFAAYVGG